MPFALLAVLLLAGFQASGDWTAVRQIPEGTGIKLVMKGGAVEGTFVAANADVLVIHLKKDSYTIDRTSIKRLDRRLAGSNRGKNIGRGLEIGFGAGLLRFAVACDGCGGSGGALVTIQSMLIGTLVGATSSATKWETVYRR